MMDGISFRSAAAGGNVPGKGTPCTLYPANGAPPMDLQLWDGGLLPDGLTRLFSAVDANFKA